MADSGYQPNNAEEEGEVDFIKLLNVTIDHWYLFVISVFVCVCFSYAYVWYTHPVYEMTATVIAADEGNDISQNILDEVGVFGKKRNIENEIAILKSRSVMQKAIGALDLNVECEIDHGLRTRVLYEKVPFRLEHDITDNRIQSFIYEIHIDESGKTGQITCEYSLPNGDEVEFNQSFTFGESFTNSLGEFKLVKTKDFNYFAQSDTAISKNYILNYKSDDVLTTGYMSRLTVSEAREKSSILRLTLPNQVPGRGVDILNMVLSVYIQENIEKKNQLASNSLRFIERQLDEITSVLDSLEGEIKAFKMTQGVSDISSEASFFLQQVGTLDQTISEIDVKLSIIDYLGDYIDSNKDLKNASPSSLGIEDPLLQQLISSLSELTSERESMLRFTKEDNPLVNSIDTKIAEAKESLKKNITSIRNGLVASKGEVNKQLEKIEQKVTRLPKAEYQLLALQRQYALKEGLYLLLLEKKSENAIILASTVSDNEILDDARSSSNPIAPKKKIVYLIGLLIGAGLPVLYIVLLLILDNRVKNFSDLKRFSKIPFLGIIPHHDSSSYLVVEDKTGSSVSEAFRSIRTNLKFMTRSNDEDSTYLHKVVQFTSAMGSEGKSFCSINLAASLALAGSKTIVVGLDLRKPKLAQYFGLSNEVGASSVLAGMVKLNDAIKPSSNIPGLDILVGGPIPPNPSELLMSSELRNMLVELAESYDTIILDTPPIGLVTDSLIISEHAITTIYVVRQNVTNLDSLQYVNDLNTSGKISSMSILLNDVKESRFGYGYGNGYGYGYGIYAENEKKSGLLSRFFSS